ncbi:GNAT family N-acetyltransferase [Sodaliphilus sp.]|uniref:GNAT family N-acetyltransferase n=1 Tax=Sodaliphilus sp. TaxID=2815818 RepID=UPI003890738B
MGEKGLTFRAATIHDAPFVAVVMMEAVGKEYMERGVEPSGHVLEVCRRDDTLYSYKNAVIAMLDGKPVGALISYPGEGYHEVKVRTFAPIRDLLDFDPMAMDDETRAGEYYLDSAAVLPEYRGRGYGRAVIEHGMQLAKRMDKVAVLACDPDNTGAYDLYTSLGFKVDGTLHIFGEDYLRMVCLL